ncbi:ATP-binding protein [Sinomonas sp. P10A9]|uniref:ATP-binding protein n=1 Tax=Sinomonas puerhi TaxID=3238584 RepID=A0AB39L8I7_9MICC
MSVDEQERLFSLEGLAESAADAGEGPRPGFRLHRLELLNWGTFDGGVRTFRLDGETSLLTGDIGSGKSTVVDAVTTLLLPAHRIDFNKAAGAQKKERTLMSYVRGFHKSERTAAGDSSKPVALRGPGSYSVVLGVFHNAVLGKTVTLALTLWATQEAGQPHRFYSLAQREQGIAGDFSDFGGDPAKLKKTLRAGRAEVFDTFENYESAFKRHFGITSGQAMELFHRTVSMKQVENITQFVRANMLDDDDVEARIANLLHHFDDLKRAHDAVLTAKDQIARLEPVRDEAARHAELAAQDVRGRAQRDQLKPWFTSRRLELSLDHESELARTRDRLDRERGERQADELAIERELVQIREDLRTQGGGRLAAIDAEILDLRGTLARQKDRGAVYAAAAERLGLVDPDERVAFDHNATALEGVERGLRERSEALNDERAQLTADRNEVRARRAELEDDVKSLLSRPDLLPRTQLELRARLCAGIGIPESALPYAGELLRVRDGESLWEGAAERTLRGFALSLLVPDEHYGAVSAWVDANNLRARLVYLKVADSPTAPLGTAAPAAEPGTLASKIAVKPGTPFREFLLGELARRFDHRCCETLEDFRRSARAVTPNGQLKTGGGRHEKDDRRDLRDRREYVLGWDNTDKVARLRAELDETVARLSGLETRIARAVEAMGRVGRSQQDLGIVRGTAFEEIDWRGTSRRIETLASEKAQLEGASDALRELSAKEADAVVRLGRAREKVFAVEKRLGANESEAKAIAEAIEECRAILAETPPADDAALAAGIAALARAVLGDEELTYKTAERAQTRVRERLTDELDALTKRLARAAEKTLNLMASFRAAYPAETTEFDESLDAAPEYNALLARLQGNDLPRFEARFKESLNQNTINEVVAFNAFLDARKTDIAARIREINASLAGIEYNPGRHIQLEHQQTTDSDIREFVVDLRSCSEGTLGADEQYSEQKFLQVEKLIERFRGRAGLTALDARWTAKVTDVRQWFTFSASEKWTETGEEHEHFTDSGGKSGGQKEKLAYTILAAALAFQFGLASTAVERPMSGRNPDRSFRFVVIDEAFGRGSDESARYGLELFRRMRLQLLVVTPLQKIHVIEPYVAHVGFVANPTGQDSRLRNMTIQEYREERMRRGG